MTIEEYWNKNFSLLGIHNNNLETTKQIRKKIICYLLEIPETEVQYYLLSCEPLRCFALNDTTELPKEVLSERESIHNYVSRDVQLIYRDDYKILKKIIEESSLNYTGLLKRGTTIINKNDIKALIDFLLINKDKLSGNFRETVKTYNSLYYYPIKLFNPHIKEKYTNNPTDYYSLLLMQWQTANGLASQISQQRSNMNNFYMSLMSILIAGILLSDSLLTDLSFPSRSLIYLTVLVIGIGLCHIWRQQINNYAKLNSIKYNIINDIERHLPANILNYEYQMSEKAPTKGHRKINFSKDEIKITYMFEIIIIIIPFILLLYTIAHSISPT